MLEKDENVAAKSTGDNQGSCQVHVGQTYIEESQENEGHLGDATLLQLFPIRRVPPNLTLASISDCRDGVLPRYYTTLLRIAWRCHLHIAELAVSVTAT